MHNLVRLFAVFLVIWLSFAAFAFWCVDFNMYRITETGNKVLKESYTVESRLLFSAALGLLVATIDTVIIACIGLLVDWLRNLHKPASVSATDEPSVYKS